MRVLIFHGYLLDGTGSNVYNARLAAALVALGHDVHLLSQERRPERLAFVDAVGDWDGGRLRVRELTHEGGRLQGSEDDGHGPAGDSHGPAGGARGRCTVYRPDIHGLLPVYVADRYEGVQARTFAHCSDAELARYIDANVAAVAELLELVDPQAALANHVVMGPVILARGLAGRVPYAVKIHGSALEYTVKPEPERFLEFAREGLSSARGVLVGSRHTAESLWRALDMAGLQERTRLGPPGVDIEQFAPREPAAAAAGLRELASRVRGAGAGPASVAEGAFAREETAVAQALERLQGEQDALVAYVGKLIVSKGVDLLIAAWPLVLRAQPRARLAVVGFGAYRDGLERLLTALAAADLQGVREVALAGRALEDDSARAEPLRHLLAFLDGLDGDERSRYLEAARGLERQVVMCGRLDHEELAELLPACEALVVPSTFPEAFGMVAAEAAACGALPISAAHSGLAEVSEALAAALPDAARGWLSFALDDRVVPAIAANVVGWLGAREELRAQTRAGLVATVRERWSWERVARGVLAAADGRLDELTSP